MRDFYLHPEYLNVNYLFEGELWKNVLGYEGCYVVSNLGRIRSVMRNGNNKCVIMKPQLNQFGYLFIHARKNGISKSPVIHRIVAKAFIPNPESKPEVNHKKGIKTDNRVSELEWATKSENAIHSYYVLGNSKHLIEEGRKASVLNTRLSDSDLKEVLKLRCDGFSAIEIAKIYNLNRNTVTKAIIKNKDRLGVAIPNNLPRRIHETEEQKINRLAEYKIKRGKKIIVTSTDGIYYEIFGCIDDAIKVLPIGRESILKVIRGYRDHHKGYVIKLAS